MQVQVSSLYWDNVDPRIPLAQKAVCDALQIPITQHRIHGFEHGEWIDWLMARAENVDVFLFIDIDCIPLKRESVLENAQAAAATGLLIGAEGAANHIDPSRSFAAAWYIYVHRQTWHELGRPTARATPTGDVCQAWTDQWRRR